MIFQRDLFDQCPGVQGKVTPTEEAGHDLVRQAVQEGHPRVTQPRNESLQNLLTGANKFETPVRLSQSLPGHLQKRFGDDRED